LDGCTISVDIGSAGTSRSRTEKFAPRPEPLLRELASGLFCFLDSRGSMQRERNRGGSLVGVGAAAKELGLARSTLYFWLAGRILASSRIAGRIVIRRADLAIVRDRAEQLVRQAAGRGVSPGARPRRG
jgi:hypothetical protein